MTAFSRHHYKSVLPGPANSTQAIANLIVHAVSWFLVPALSGLLLVVAKGYRTSRWIIVPLNLNVLILTGEDQQPKAFFHMSGLVVHSSSGSTSNSSPA